MARQSGLKLSLALTMLVALSAFVIGCSGDGVPQSLAEVPRIRAPELRELMEDDEKQVTVVDTRSLASFIQGHIPGAVSIPTEEIEARSGELDKNDIIVAYCT